MRRIYRYMSILLAIPQFAAGSGVKAQYEPVSRVLLSSGTNQMDYYHRRATPEILEDATRLEEFKAVEEVNSIYRAISRLGAPALLLASNSIPERLFPYMKNKKSEFTLANEVFGDLITSKHLSVMTLPDEIIDDPKYRYDESRIFPDRWIRDWGPFNIGATFIASDGGRRSLLANPEIARELNATLRNSPFSLIGGAFMKTSDGVCGLSVTDDPGKRAILGVDVLNATELAGPRLEYLQDVVGCRQIIPIEPLPLEPLGHLDLFVKFLSDKKVAIARYSSDQVQVRAVRKIESTECFPPASGSCEQTWTRNYFTNSISGVESQGVEFKGLRDYISNQYPGVDVEFRELWRDLGPYKALNLKNFSDRLARQLRSAGFEVIEIEQPQPVVTLKIEQLQTLEGKIKIEKIHASLTFPTYLNSLLINGTAFVPSYKYWSDPRRDQAAADGYRSAGFKIQLLPSDFIILEGGTIHCVTKELH